MGAFLSGLSTLYDTYLLKKPPQVLILGLDQAGKTTVLYKLVEGDKTIRSVPTVGFNIETVRPQPGIMFSMWDIGSGARARHMWRRSLNHSRGLIYVVDSADRDRFSESYDELRFLLDSSGTESLPLIVLANKQDLPNRADCREISEALRLHELTSRGRKWHVQTTCARTGEGLQEAMEVLCSFVKEKSILR